MSKRLIVDFDAKYDRFVGGDKKFLKLEDKLLLLNEALEIYFENRVEKAELNSRVREELRPLENKEVELKLVKKKDQFSIFEIPKDNYKILRKRAKVEKGDCGIKDIKVITFQTDDLNNALKNSYWKPSFEWEHTLADEGSEGYYVWHLNDFNIKKLIVDYYRKPKEIHLPSMTTQGYYVDWNGIKRTKDQDLELDNVYARRIIVDLAYLISSTNLGDTSNFQLQLNKIFNQDKL